MNNTERLNNVVKEINSKKMSNYEKVEVAQKLLGFVSDKDVADAIGMNRSTFSANKMKVQANRYKKVRMQK